MWDSDACIGSVGQGPRKVDGWMTENGVEWGEVSENE
jgi:hypothetical protein